MSFEPGDIVMFGENDTFDCKPKSFKCEVLRSNGTNECGQLYYVRALDKVYSSTGLSDWK